MNPIGHLMSIVRQNHIDDAAGAGCKVQITNP